MMYKHETKTSFISVCLNIMSQRAADNSNTNKTILHLFSVLEPLRWYMFLRDKARKGLFFGYRKCCVKCAWMGIKPSPDVNLWSCLLVGGGEKWILLLLEADVRRQLIRDDQLCCLFPLHLTDSVSPGLTFWPLWGSVYSDQHVWDPAERKNRFCFKESLKTCLYLRTYMTYLVKL